MITARRMGRVWAAVLAIGGAATLQAQTYNITDYFPLAPNSHWRLVDASNPHSGDTDAFVWTVLGTGPQTVGSYSVWKVKTTCDEPTDARHLDQDFWNFYGTGSTKLGLYGVYKGTAVTGVPGDQTIILSQPLRMGDANMAVGWTSTSSATGSVRTDYGTFTGTFTATPVLEAHLDSLTTPLGVFNDVIRLRITVTVTVTLPLIGNRTFDFLGSRFWLARSIGLVRQNQTMDPDDAVYQVLEEGTLNGVAITPTGTVTHTVTFVAGTGGSLSGTTPQTIADGANTTPVGATATTGYHFVRWTSGAALFSTNNPLTVTNVTADLTLTAEFAVNTYTVTFLAGTGGSVAGTTPQTIAHGANATPVSANAAAGYHFVRWTSGGTLFSTNTPLTVTNVTADQTLTAEFAADAVTHTVSFLAGTGGSVAGTTPQTIAEGGNATAVSANAAAGYHFVRWTSAGALFSTSNPLTVTNVTTNLTLTAEFALNTYSVTYAAGLHGSISGTATQTIAHGGSTTAVTATPATGYHFVDWSDGSTANPRQDTNVTSDLALTATFAADATVAEVQVLPDSLARVCRVGTSPADATFSVRNGLEGTLSYTISESISWLSLSPAAGSSSGEWDVITVSFAAATLPPGAYGGTIVVTAGSSVKTVHVSLQVTDFLLERDFPAGCYQPGDTVDVSLTMDFGEVGVVTSLAVSETLPAGWQFQSVVSGPEPDSALFYPETHKVEFAWVLIPDFPFTLTYRVGIPAATTYGTYCFSGTTAYRTGGPETTVPVYGESCIEVGDCCVPHQADQNGDWRINLTPELTRLIQFYNRRSYHCAGRTEDGYDPGLGSTTCTPHQADQNRDWVIQLSPELTRLIQFYNSDGYHCEEGTEDGYGPGLARRKSASQPGTLLALRQVAIAGAAGTRMLDVSVTLSHTDPAALTCLSVSETLPPGWTFSGVVSKSAPSLQPLVGATGTLDFAWIAMPTLWPVTLTYRVSLPAGTVGGKALVGTASYREDADEITVPLPDSTLTTSFPNATAVAPNGSFLAVPATAEAGQGLWDLTGTYSARVAGNPLTLNLAHDTTGYLSGSATLTLNPGKGLVQVTLPVRGGARGTGEALLVTLAMKGADAGGRASAALSLNLALNPATRQLMGPITGTIAADGVTVPVSETLLLSVPSPMDGSWTLRFDLTPVGTGVTGTAMLTLSNDVQLRYTVRGKLSGQTVLASLAGTGDPAAKSIRTAITPLAGGGARLNALSGKVYGQSLVLPR